MATLCTHCLPYSIYGCCLPLEIRQTHLCTAIAPAVVYTGRNLNLQTCDYSCIDIVSGIFSHNLRNYVLICFANDTVYICMNIQFNSKIVPDTWSKVFVNCRVQGVTLYSAADKDLRVKTSCITVSNYCYVCCSGTILLCI